MTNSSRQITLFDRAAHFGMRMTIGARFSVGNIPPLPLVDSLFEETIVGLVNVVDIVLTFPFCPFTKEKFESSRTLVSRFSSR